MKKMMILGGSILQIPAIKKARELGYYVIVVDYDEKAEGFPLADEKLIFSTMDQEEVYRQALIHKPDVILTSTSDGPVRTAAYVNERLGKQPDLSYEDSFCATIKSYMRDRLKQCGIPIPDYRVTCDFKEFTEAILHFKGICIAKPADNAGSRGVTLVEKPELHGKTIETLNREESLLLGETYHYCKNNSRNGIVMVEEFMKGPEVSVEAMVVDRKPVIIAITDKIVTRPPFFVELGHSEPSILRAEILEEIRVLASRSLEAIRLQNGPAHVEIKVTEQGPKIVELAARLGGDYITSHLVPLSTGVDLVGSSIALACGEAVDLEPKWSRGAAIRFINGRHGTLREVVADRQIHELPGIKEVVIWEKKGDHLTETKSSNDRLGYVIAVADTPEEANRRAEGAMKLIHVVMEDETSIPIP